MNYIILIFVALVCFWLGQRVSATKSAGLKSISPEKLKGIQRDAHLALSERTEKRKEKILEFMKKEAVHREELQLCGIDSSRKEFTRADVEKLLEVSEATARKYLNELEAGSKIAQIGLNGPDVYYILI